jgi:hypothetical protein
MDKRDPSRIHSSRLDEKALSVLGATTCPPFLARAASEPGTDEIDPNEARADCPSDSMGRSFL